MGNAQSQKKSNKGSMYFNEELIDSIDLLASKLIFEQSFQNLKELQNPSYCEEVSILTQRLLKKKLNKKTISMVSNRIKYGTQDLFIIDKQGFKQLRDINDRDYEKDVMCLNVSKFYTKIFQAYSAIVGAINPVYVYTDAEGTQQIRTVMDDISMENKSKADIGLRSMCSRRIAYLKPKKMGEKQMTLQVNQCKMNDKSSEIPVMTREHVDKRKDTSTDITPSMEESQSDEKETPEETPQSSPSMEEPHTNKEPQETTTSQDETEKESPEQQQEKQPEKEEKQTESDITKMAKDIAESLNIFKQPQPQPQKGGDDKDNEEDDSKNTTDEETSINEIDEPANEPSVMDDGSDDEDEYKEEDEDEDEEPAEGKEPDEDQTPDGKMTTTMGLIGTMTLADEPGIQSLENLYKDTMKIETDQGKVTGLFVRSSNSEKQYKQDLQDFYKAFIPNGKFNSEEIKSFSDIKLTDFTKTKECNDNTDESIKQKWGSTIVGDSSKREDRLFVEYGTHFKKMINNVQEREAELIGCLHDLFDFNLDEEKETEVPIQIKGSLTESDLDNTIRPKILKTIKKMYIDCEKDFQQGVNIYNKIYKQRNNL
jgi:hypothetical protein